MIQLQKGNCLIAPGIFDGVSAKVADQMGFSALYMSGYSLIYRVSRKHRRNGNYWTDFS